MFRLLTWLLTSIFLPNQAFIFTELVEVVDLDKLA